MSTHNMDTQKTEFACDEVESLLPLVVDGVLNEESDPALFAHIARCVNCQDVLVQHDLIQIALEQSSESSSTVMASPFKITNWHHRRLPWPVAMAASLCATIGLWAWLNATQNTQDKGSQTHTQVVPVKTEDGQSVYVVFDGENVTVIDPRSIDGKASLSREETVPVKLTK